MPYGVSCPIYDKRKELFLKPLGIVVGVKAVFGLPENEGIKQFEGCDTFHRAYYSEFSLQRTIHEIFGINIKPTIFPLWRGCGVLFQ